MSYSILLSEPGVDYTGALLETKDADASAAHKGDLIGFTAKTPHRVTALESGERYVLICFGMYE